GPEAIGRVLADEGAELRHSEVLAADAHWRAADPYEAMFRNVLKFSTFEEAAASIRRLDNLRRQFARTGDREGLRLVREAALKGKRRAQMISRNGSVGERKRAEKAEIAEWFTVWLNQPELFDDWLGLRQSSKDFRARFREESDPYLPHVNVTSLTARLLSAARARVQNQAQVFSPPLDAFERVAAHD